MPLVTIDKSFPEKGDGRIPVICTKEQYLYTFPPPLSLSFERFVGTDEESLDLTLSRSLSNPR